MGKMNDVLHRYLDDAERFADLYNGIMFQGRQVITPEELTEASEQYKEKEEHSGKKDKNPSTFVTRNRDLKKYMKNGALLRVLSVENQNLTDYSMPFRCMEYDTMEYRKQLQALRKKNARAKDYETAAERMCRVKRNDRLNPSYTICLYHGEEAWDGPRTLKDMMKFEDEDAFEKYFADYPMLLYCVNEKNDLSVFHTEIRELFEMMRCRGDKEKMKKTVEDNDNYKHLSEETLEAISVVVKEPSVFVNKEMYKSEEEEGYDMCKALRDWAEEERSEGRVESRTEDILDILGIKGDVPDELRQSIMSEKDVAILKRWIIAAVQAESIEAFAAQM